MRKIKPDYSTAELASIFGVNEVTIRRWAEKQMWQVTQRPERQGGNLYRLVDLPERIQQGILADAFEVPPEGIHDLKLPLEQYEALFREFNAMPGKAQDTAYARAQVLDVCREFVRGNGFTVVEGRKAFTSLYKIQAVPGLPPEIYGQVKTLSPKTLELWTTNYNKFGLVGLAARHFNSGREPRITPEMQLVFRAAIAKTPHIRMCHLVEQMKISFPKDQWVHKSSVCRWFNNWKAHNRAEYLMSLNPSEYKNKIMPAFGSLATAPHAGHTWEMDSTPADIMTSDGKRCSIVAAIDVHTRKVVMVVANTSNSKAVAMCIRKGLMLWGKPEKIKKDNVADYSSKHIRAVLSALQIETPPLPPYSPEHKGIIERFFGTISTDLEERLPDYTGHSVAERAALRPQGTWAKKVFTRQPGYKRGDKKAAIDVPLTQAEFMHMIECWLDVYENRVHSGFANEPGRKLKGLTPAQAFEQSPKKPLIVKDERMLDILLAEVDTRTVGKKGIRYKDAFYNDAPLVDYSGQQVRISLHPDNAGAVYVFTLDGDFICIARDEALEGIRLEDYLKAKASKLKRDKDKVRAADILSENISVSYTHNLLTGKVREATAAPVPAPETDGPLEFRPEFRNEATDEARKAYEAYDGTARPAAPVGEMLHFEPSRGKVIYPKAPAEDVDPDFPTGRDAGNPIILFEYYLGLATGRGIKSEDVRHIYRLWDNYPQVQKNFPRPDEECLNIIEDHQYQPEPEQLKEVSL